MAIANYFYNKTTRKYVALFGTLFNQLKIERENNAGTKVQELIVPLAYGPYQKFLSRITQDPNLNRASAITLPRMAFEITSYQYDGERNIAVTKKVRKEQKPESDDARNFVYSPTPYNIEFSLFIMTKYSEDATKIMEQIVPFFQPDFTVTANLIDDLDPIDVPIILNGVSTEEIYEGDYIERRAVMYTLNFTMKAWFFGPQRSSKIIKFIDTQYAADTAANAAFEEHVTIQPGLTANGTPTTDINNTIPYTDIEFDDDWGIIKITESL